MVKHVFFYFGWVSQTKSAASIEIGLVVFLESKICSGWFPSTGIDGANMDRVEELAHVRRQAAAENQQDYNVEQAYCEEKKLFFGPNVLAK